ncbi:hypothetical protein J437_LFUL013380 [Ladona fulva]|uniref:Reverse transcriptase n=1 Tax=Ladona fulva TaxID=123851 RepID=A0A8K0KGI6_LADFU|nr:hypothetical protein J437_LFUL013380 [Ladona fulva]
MEDLVPHRFLKAEMFPFWVKSDTVFCIKNKHRAFCLMKKFPNPHTKNNFAVLRRQAKFLLKLDYRNYIDSVSSQAASNPMRFWTMINSRRKGGKIPERFHLDQRTTSGPNRSFLFNEYLQSVFTPPSNSYDFDALQVESVCSFSLSSIATTADNLYTNRAIGSDLIGSMFLKNSAPSLSQPVTALINRCFSPGHFPSAWKAANIIPLFKSGDRSSVKSYRPISVLPILAMVCERII